MWPLMTSKVILNAMKKLPLYKVIHQIRFHHNWFINECAGKNLAQKNVTII